MGACLSCNRPEGNWTPDNLPPRIYNLTVGQTQWKTSYLTFMSSLSVGRASTEAIVSTLEKGYRAIHIEIHERKGKLYVSRGSKSTDIELNDALGAIAQNAFQGTNYPLMVMCHSAIRERHEDIEDIFTRHFEWRLMNRIDPGEFFNTKIEKLANNIILCSDAVQRNPGQQDYGLHKISTLSFGDNENSDVYYLPIETVDKYNPSNFDQFGLRVRKQVTFTFPTTSFRLTNPNCEKPLNAGVHFIGNHAQTRDKNHREVCRLFRDEPIIETTIPNTDVD